MVRRWTTVGVFVLAGLGGCQSSPRSRTYVAPPTTLPTTQTGADQRIVDAARILGPGALDGDTYTITMPRLDIALVNELGDIPPAAGVASAFHFFLCPCGKTNVVGHFCVLDYEANDVIDELRAAQIQIVSVGPMFIGERPRVLMVRFQGEAHGPKLATALRSALSWMGQERGKARK
jgi:hypothetical protein